MTKRRGKLGKSFVWVILGLTILGLGGYAIPGLTGAVRVVASVGDQEITLDDYARALQEDIRTVEAQTKQPLDFATAQAYGLDQAALGRLIGQAGLDQEASDIGLSVDDENLLKQITQIPQFKGANGQFDREAYQFALSQSGLTEARFEKSIRLEAARTLLQGAIVSGVSVPSAYTDILIAYAGEARNFEWVRLNPDALTEPLAAPTDEVLKTYYQDNLASFTTPRKRKITYAWLAPEMLVDTVEIDEEALRALYAEKDAEYNTPERRLVERLAFNSEATANDAMAQIEVGGTTFEALVAERGLELSDVDLGDLSLADLGDAGAAVFAANTGDIVGPLPTPIGPALFRVNGVLSGESTTFEQAEPELRDELAADRARRLIDTQELKIDELLAGGATLEDLAAETNLELGSIDWHSGEGEGIAAYPAFNAAARDVTAEDFPKVIRLDDGGLFAMRLEAEIDPEVQPFETVVDRVITLWESDATEAALLEIGNSIAAKLAEGVTFEGQNLVPTVVTAATRGRSVLGTPPDFVSNIFTLEPGEVHVQAGFGSVFVARLTDILQTDSSNPQITALRDGLSEQALGDLSQDIYAAFANDIQNRIGINIDQRAVNAVNANFQ